MKKRNTVKQGNTAKQTAVANQGVSSRMPRRIRGFIAAGLLGAMGLSGCGMFHPEDYPTDTAKLPKATSNPAKVSKATFRHSWNLKVDHGTIHCKLNSGGDPILYFTAPNGTEYALNSVTGNGGRPDIEDIADGSVGTIRSFAFSVCKVK